MLNVVIEGEHLMSVLYFCFATAQLWRLIVQTKAHPRTAMLVKTIANAFDDLWHFIILLVFVCVGYMALAMAQKNEFFCGAEERIRKLPEQL